MNPGDLVTYIKNPPKRVTDCGIFEKKVGLLIRVDRQNKEAIVISQGETVTVDLDWIIKFTGVFWPPENYR